MAVFVMTWNPSRWTMDQARIDEIVRATSQGREVPDRWSTGARRGGIRAGDHAYLLRQHTDRGIVASGVFDGEVYPEPHWDGSDRDASYADVRWRAWLPVGDELPTAALTLHVGEVAWDRLQGSGVLVARPAAARLDALWLDHLALLGRAPERGAGEVEPSATYIEGAVSRVEVNRYERDPQARAAALSEHGLRCDVCRFSFAERYGALGEGFVHVHHLRELSTLPPGYEVDPKTDLVPVCANCHAMLHRERPALTPDELRRRLRPPRP